MGAWIETLTVVCTFLAFQVAPRVGAWIETGLANSIGGARQSHPVWVRGLKLELAVEQFVSGGSHPVWVRGLKH